MRIRFTRKAIEDLAEIADYLNERNRRAALHVRASILESLDILKAFPKAGRPQSTESVRKLVTRRYAYLIYYVVNDVAAEIVVLSIRHPARKREYEDT